MKFVMEKIEGQMVEKLCIYAETGKEQNFLEAIAEYMEPETMTPW